MIVDIVKLPIHGECLSSYDAVIPVFLPQEYSVDEVYMVGYSTDTPIHTKFHRYKIIEHINNQTFEHIAVTERPIKLNRKFNFQNIYVITTRYHNGSTIETYRYFKSISMLLNLMHIREAIGVKTIHQLAIEVLYKMYPSIVSLSEMEIYLGKYCHDRHDILTALTTASVSEVLAVMHNIKDIHDTVYSALCDKEIGEKEINDYLDDSIALPNRPPNIGLSSLLMSCKYFSITEKDLLPFIDKDNYGFYNSCISKTPVVDLKLIDRFNRHLQSGALSNLDNHELIDLLTDIELCNYTDLSIEIPYTVSVYPDFILHYSGSVFNRFSINTTPSNITLNIDLKKLYDILKRYFGVENFHNAKPKIQICKTFLEEVYIKYITSDDEIIEYFDLITMSILSPVVLNNTSEQYMMQQLKHRF